MDIKDIFAPIVADMRHKSAEGEVRKLRKALFPAPIEGVSNDAYDNLLGVLCDLEHGQINDVDLEPIRRVLSRLSEARRVLEETA